MSGRKTGWHPADQRMADWDRLDQAPPNAYFFACEVRGGCITQGPGWGDHYRWQRPGNYVEFPTHADGSNVEGDYVVRRVVDRDGRLSDTDARNNSAYAWIQVNRDGDVAICERGLGDTTWDPHKQLHTPSFWLAMAGRTLPTPSTTADSATRGCE